MFSEEGLHSFACPKHKVPPSNTNVTILMDSPSSALEFSNRVSILQALAMQVGTSPQKGTPT
jgi:hypothetical protein